MQRDQQLPGGGRGGSLSPGREIPLRGPFRLFPGGRHGIFPEPWRTLENRAGPAGVPPVRQRPRHCQRLGALGQGRRGGPGGGDPGACGKRPGRGGENRPGRLPGPEGDPLLRGSLLSGHRLQRGRVPAGGGFGPHHCGAHPLPGPPGGAGGLVLPDDGPFPAQLRGEGDRSGEEKAGVSGFRGAAVYPLRAERPHHLKRLRPSAAHGAGEVHRAHGLETGPHPGPAGRPAGPGAGSA